MSLPNEPPNVEIHCADAFDWLDENPGDYAVVTSPPDADEIGMPPKEWEGWFRSAIEACATATSGPLVFYFTDRKAGGEWWSKAHIALDVLAPVRPVWHKVALRRAPGSADLHRPTYSHMVAFRGKPGKSTPDVVMRGTSLYPNGTGRTAARLMVAWAGANASRIVDPFCGVGTIPLEARDAGLSVVGVDLDPEQCAKAREVLKIAGN